MTLELTRDIVGPSERRWKFWSREKVRKLCAESAQSGRIHEECVGLWQASERALVGKDEVVSERVTLTCLADVMQEKSVARKRRHRAEETRDRKN